MSESKIRMKSGAKTRPVSERFWEKVDQSGGKEKCWPWLASYFRPSHESGPYGRFVISRCKSVLAHRTAYELSNGAIPEGMVVRHTCDHAYCCNPSHLLIGSQKENMNDRQERNRTARGEKGGKAKLTERQVLEIRSDPNLTYRQIRNKYGICDGTIWAIKTKRNWRHV